MVSLRGPRQRLVVVGVDGAPDGQRALEWAAAEAERRRWPLQIEHAVEYASAGLAVSLGPEPALAEDHAIAQQIADTAVADVRRSRPTVQVTGEWVAGDPATVLARTATERDILVVGSRGLGRVASVLLGSVSSAVVGHAVSPVVVVPDKNPLPGRPDGPRGVVLGVDGSDASTAATRFAFEAASVRGSPLTVVHAVWDRYTESQAVVAVLSDPKRVVVDESERLDVAETIAGWREQFPDVRVVTRYANGRPDRVLADADEVADLLVVGARGRGSAASALLGSVSRHVLKRARCPVAIVRCQPGS